MKSQSLFCQWMLLCSLCLAWSACPPLLAWQAKTNPAGLTPTPQQQDPQELEKLLQQLAPKVSAATVGIVSTADDVDDQGVGTGGSGVIISATGLVLTAAHVIAQEERQVLVLLGSRKIPAKIVGYMGRGDFGVIQLEPPQPETWPFLPMAEVTRVAPGTICLGAGHTARIDPTRPAPIRFGRVLGERRDESFVDELGGRAELDNVLVSDAPFLPGDSGGPLVNLQGEVIGVHSSIGPDHRENLHIPIWQFRKHWPKLMAGVKRPVPENSPKVSAQEMLTELAFTGKPKRSQIADYHMSIERTWSRTHKNYLRTFQSCLPKENSCVQIFVNDRAAAWGMIVAAEGYIVTKASSLTGEAVVCRVLEKDYPAKVLERNEAHDLALLQIAERELTPVNWKAAAEMPLGTLLLTRSPQGGVLQVSVVSVEQCSIPAEVPDHSPSHEHGFLGIELKPDAKRPQISRVLPNTAAKEHGLQVGDTLHSVNGQKIDAGSELIELLRQHRPGDAVKLEIERAGKQQSLELKLGTVPSDRWAESLEFAPWNHSSGGISVRSYPFPAVITHDGFIAPQHCGGPVYDLHGQLVGLNIARVDRTATYLLPTHVLQPVVAQMLAKMR